MTKLLVVDDSQTVLTFLQAVLEGAGYEVTTATDGADALSKLYQSRPDLIVTDAVMPGMGGFDLLRAIRSDSSIESLPVIILTSSATQDAAVGNPQPDAFVKKSSDFAPLLTEIAECLQRGR
jgi:CheY-like chemotaxis protein